jgi:hypothetical protein
VLIGHAVGIMFVALVTYVAIILGQQLVLKGQRAVGTFTVADRNAITIDLAPCAPRLSSPLAPLNPRCCSHL